MGASGLRYLDGATLLVVDDDAATRETFSVVLAEEGYHVLTAGDGPSALALLDALSPPCVVLLDLMMPGMNGYELLKRLRADPHRAGTPVLVVTASKIERPPAEADGWLRKPMDLDELLDAIQRHCAAAATPP